MSNHHFDDSEPSPDATRHANWLLKKAGVKTIKNEPPSPLGADGRAIVEANRGKIKEARIDLLQQAVEQLWDANSERAQAEIELATRLNNVIDHYETRLARLESQMAHLTWMTHDIDPIEESYQNNWVQRKLSPLQRFLAWLDRKGRR